MKLIKNKIYIDQEGEGWVLDSVDPINFTRLRYPNFNWIGHPEQVGLFFIETDIDYTNDFWDKAGLKEIEKYWKSLDKNIKLMKFLHDETIRN